MFPLILLPVEANPVPEKERSKKNPVSFCSFSNSKIVLTLLTEVIAVHVGIFVIYVQGMGLQWLISGLLKGGGSWGRSGSSSLQNGLENLLQVIFRILKDIGNSGGSNSNGRFCL